MSNDQHTWDIENISGKHFSQGGSGCLNRHQKYKDGDPCSHQWQAYQRALSDPTKYNWPAYQELSVEKRKKSFVMETFWFIARVAKPPQEGEWDLDYEFKNKRKETIQNFRTDSSTPYWHEAHHVVPNSELRSAIRHVGKDHRLEGKIIAMVRGGLMGESYNLNDKINMIILPMDKKIAKALGLPRHRKTRLTRSHKSYSKHVASRLKAIFAPLKEKVEECKGKLPRYKKCRKQIEDISTDLYPKIIDAGKDAQALGRSQSLDEIPASKLATAPPKAGYGGVK